MKRQFNQIEETVSLVEGTLIVNYNEYSIFEVVGAAMENEIDRTFPKGCSIYVKKLNKELYNTTTTYENYPFWVIETTQSQLPIFKEVISLNSKKKILFCKSLNPDFADFKIDLADITNLYYVVFVRKNVTHLKGEPYDINLNNMAKF